MLESVPLTPLTEASIFGMPCRAEVETPPLKQFVVGNHRARKRQARMDKLPVMFEYACSPESNMGRSFNKFLMSSFIAHALGQSEEEKDPEITAMVTRLLSPAEMLASPEALEAVRLEPAGLEKAGVWDLLSVREYDQVAAEARRSSVKVHFGQLMSIASVKFAELATHLQKMKGRIVCRGDCAKDEHSICQIRRTPKHLQKMKGRID